MIKKGFTLAEVLITLSIIGILVALTAPSLIKNNNDRIAMSKLSSAVSDIETSFQSAMIKEGVENLYGTEMWKEVPVNENKGDKEQFYQSLNKYMRINSYKNSFSDFYGTKSVYTMSDNGGKGEAVKSFPYISSPFAITMNSGSTLFISTLDNKSSLEEEKKNAIKEGCSLNTRAADVVIDINGNNGPNIIGKDIFYFILGEDGVLYPFGNKDTNRIIDNAESLFSCSDSNKGSENNSKGIGCTARAIKNGYKIDY